MRLALLLVPPAFLFTLVIAARAQSPETPAGKAPPEPLPVLQGRPDAPEGDPGGAGPLALAEPFRSQALGISLRPPAGFKMVRKLGGDEVDFVDEQRKWTLRVARMPLNDAMTLEPSVDKAKNLPRAGLLEVTLDRLKATMPGAVVLRDDVINLGAADAGMIVLRHVAGLETLLSQQALVRSSDRLYYSLSLTSPGNARDAGNAGDDAGERQAVETFQNVLDTVELLDQRPVRREQDDRLYATRALYVNLGAAGKLEKALVPKQWFRVLRHGKDIGYVYTVEETGDGIPGQKRAAGAAARSRGKAAGAALGANPGILIGTRSRTMPDENVRVDSESWMFCTPDRRSEQWSTLTVVQDLKNKTEDHAMTLGSSTRKLTRVLDGEAKLRGEQWDKDDPNQPPMFAKEDYELSVTHVSKTEAATPLNQQLAPWYMPQALGHLLPRVLPLREPKQYMFATYVDEARAVMHRYVDVGAEKRVTFAGESMRAIPIADRIGLEGSVTMHYVTSDGTYLGSENADSGIVMMPSDEQTLLKIWKDADLTRPADVKENAAGQNAARGPAAARPSTGAPPAGGAPAKPSADRVRPAAAR